MVKEKSRTARTDPQFQKDMMEISRIRLQKGLARFNQKDLGMAEMTRLLRGTKGFKISMEELKTKPRKEDLEKLRRF